MKKVIIITLSLVLVVLSPILYLLYTFAFTGPMPDAEFEKNLPSIVKNLEVKFDGEGEDTLVMIHGYPDSLELWDKQVEYLKQDYSIARFTLPGFELEDNGERPHYSMKQIRMITDSFIKSLNKESVTVLAHDWGAIYAFPYLDKNDLVDRVILFDIGSFGDEERPVVNAKYTFALAVAWTLPEFIGEKLTFYTADEILNIEDVDPNKTAADLRTDPRMTYPYWHLWRSILSKDLAKASEVEDYGTPFLFLYGKDKKVWFHAKSWESKIQTLNKGQVEAVPGGHWFMQSSPDLVNQKIENWLKAN
ncbi:MAG: alpha/beta hydrolase [Moritella sp.]|uniref:alpha/beta fold hydrolase n=1 Tax=Moritella sp. TaxID=78556 RepID=UPI0029B87972|nr:alpha/beta hydrolase [Moritella sp.]MDX2320144.1 alpha/beta hydrolase [Moritella sp.]